MRLTGRTGSPFEGVPRGVAVRSHAEVLSARRREESRAPQLAGGVGERSGPGEPNAEGTSGGCSPGKLRAPRLEGGVGGRPGGPGTAGASG